MTQRKTPGIAAWVHRFTARPALTLLVLLFAVLAALWLASRLQIQSSRHALVSPDHPYQARLLSLVEDFGLPDDLIFWVQGGSAAQRRAAIDALQTQLQGQQALAQARFTGAPQLDDWAPLVAVQNPAQLNEVLAGLGTAEHVRAALGTGLLGILDLGLAQMNSEVPGQLPKLDQLRQNGALIGALKQLMQGVPLDELSAQLIARRESSQPSPNTVVALDEAGYLRNDDASALLLVVSNALQDDRGEAMQRVVQASRSAQRTVAETLAPGVQIRLSGYPVLQVDEQAAIARGLLYSSAATGLGIVLVLALAFSSLRKSLIALIPLGAGAALSLGALQLLFGQVNAITSSFLAVLLGLGIDISVHFLARVDEGLKGAAPEQSRGVIAAAFAASGPAVVIGTLTTALAFLLLFGAEFAAYGELGVITAVGLLLMLACAFLVIPALLLLWPGSATASTARAKGQAWIAALAARVVEVPRALVGLGLVAALAGAYFGAGLSFNPRYFDFMPSRLESVALLERLEQESVASPLVVSVRASSLQDAERKAKLLRASSLVAAVQSPSDLLAEQSSDFAALAALKRRWPSPEAAKTQLSPDALRKEVQRRALAFVDAIDEQLFRLSMQRSAQQAELTKTLKAWKGQWNEIEALARNRPESAVALATAQARIESIRQSIAKVLASPALDNKKWTARDLPASVAARFVAKDPNAGLRLLVTPAGDFWAPRRAQQFLELVQRVDPQSAGHSMSVIIHSSMIRRDFFRASAWALLAISLLLWVIFRSFKTLLMVVLPLAVGWCWMLGVYALLGIQLNAANIVVLPLVLGIGVDAGVHLMHRAQEESKDRAGIIAAVASTGSAVTICALTTMVGFGGLMVAEYGGMKSLGLSMVIGIFTTWLSTVVLMPALLSLFRAD